MIRAIGVCPQGVLELNIDVQGDGYVVVIFHPMRAIYGNMNTVSRVQFVGGCATLKLRFVDWCIVVDCPEPFDFFFRKNLSIGAIEYMNCLCSLYLKQETAFAVDMVCRNALGRCYEDKGIFAHDLRIQVIADSCLDFLPTGAEKVFVDG